MNPVLRAAFRHTPIILLSLVFFYGTGRHAAHAPLGFDEIFTYTIARFDSPLVIINALLDKADNHPPLDYLIRHFSMRFLGDSEFAFRFPSIVAVLVGALCLYAFILRRCSLLPAVFAFAFPLSTMVLAYAYVGRGYAFLFASICCSLVAWQLATEKPTKVRLMLLVLSLSLGPFSHFYGVMNYAPIAAGEAWRSWRRGKLCWPIIIAMIVSLASLFVLLPFVLNASSFSGAFWTTYSPATPFSHYMKLLGWSVPALVAGLAACSLLLVLRPNTTSPSAPQKNLEDHEVIASLTLCAVPFFAFAIAVLVTNALTSRYTLITVVGLTFLFATLISHAAWWRRDMALAFAVCASLWTSAWLINIGIDASANSRAVSAKKFVLIDTADTPVVIANTHDFLVTQFYLPAASRQKVVYLSDSSAAKKYLGFDTDERAFRNLKRFVPLNIVNFCDFAEKHRYFVVIANDRNWLVPQLLDKAAVVTRRPVKHIKGSVYDIDLGESARCG